MARTEGNALAREGTNAAAAHERLWAAALTVLVGLLFFYDLGAAALWDQDESKYTGVAQAMLRTGDWLTLHWNGEPWFVHPPLYMWLVAATGALVGFSEFVARFWSAFFAAAGVGLTAVLGRAMFSPRTGLLAGFVLATTLQWFAQARIAVFDSMLAFWILGVVYAFWLGYRGRRAAYLWAFVCAALGTMTKGPVAAVLPGLGLLVFLWRRGQLDRLREIPWGSGLTLYAVLGLGWYAASYALHGEPFARTVFGYYTVNRYVGVVEGQSGPLWYYVPVLLLGALPWAAFFPAAWAHHVRHRSDAASDLVVTWCVFVVVFFSLAGTKLPNYVLSVYPIAAIAIGRTWEVAITDDRPQALRSGWALLGVVFVLLIVGVAAYGLVLYPQEFRRVAPALVPTVGALLVGGATSAVLGLRGSQRAAIPVLGASVVAFLLLLIVRVAPEIERQRFHREVARAAAAAARAGEVRISLWTWNSLIYYGNMEWRYAWDVYEFRRLLCRVHPRQTAVVVMPLWAWEESIRPLAGRALVVERVVADHVILRKPYGRSARCGFEQAM
ncbi:MAG: glycosyltransferase family 39 protein [Armatimonadota bacterium]|nr:glycosyltransferase family 39 protein [Armatimonadota bacterium]